MGAMVIKNNEQAISVLQKIAKLAKNTNDLESEKFAYEKIGDRLHNRLLEPDENNLAWYKDYGKHSDNQ
jgi:hypothetical protein